MNFAALGERGAACVLRKVFKGASTRAQQSKGGEQSTKTQVARLERVSIASPDEALASATFI